MKIIVITQESFFRDETSIIETFLRNGIDRVHIRKPSSSETEFRSLIESISPKYYDRLSVHDHYPLAKEYGLGGVHLNSRNPSPSMRCVPVISCSCHSIDGLMSATDCDYRFLSPVFDSISKQGYRHAFSPEELKSAADSGIIDSSTVALGGVTPDKLPLLREIGFGGAAFLGAVWGDTVRINKTLELINKYR